MRPTTRISFSPTTRRLREAGASLAAADYAVLATIFGSFLTAVGRAFIEGIGKKILFPMSAILTFMQWALKMVQLWRDKQSSLTAKLVRATVATVISFSIIIAVGLALFAATPIVPFLFSGAIVTGILESIADIYQKWSPATPVEKAALIGRPIGQAFTLTAVIALFILKTPVLFALGAAAGITGSIIGLGMIIRELCASSNPLRPVTIQGSAQETMVLSNTRMLNRLNAHPPMPACDAHQMASHHAESSINHKNSLFSPKPEIAQPHSTNLQGTVEPQDTDRSIDNKSIFQL